MVRARVRGQGRVVKKTAGPSTRSPRRPRLRTDSYRSPLHLVVQQREHVVALELVAAFEAVQFDHKSQATDFGAQRFRHRGGGAGGAAGGQQIVADDDALARLDRILVDLQRVVAVLQFVLPLHNVSRQLLGFAHRNEACVQAVGQRRPKDESPRLDAQNQINVLVDVMLGEGIDEAGEAQLVFEQRGDVVEKDAGFGEVGNFANELLEVVAVVRLRRLHGSPHSFDAKRLRFQQGRGGFADLVHTRGARALQQTGPQRTVLLARARSHHFNVTVFAVAYPAGDADLRRFPFHEPAEADALDASGDDVAAGLQVSHE